MITSGLFVFAGFGNECDIISMSHNDETQTKAKTKEKRNCILNKLNQFFQAKSILIVESRWLYDYQRRKMYCNHRCIWNWNSMFNSIINNKDILDKFYIIGGNTGILPFETQYYLMRNCKGMIAMHGAIFAWTVVMNSNQFVFEVTITNWWNSKHWAKMLNINYQSFRCQTCCNDCKKMNTVNTTALLQKLLKFAI